MHLWAEDCSLSVCVCRVFRRHIVTDLIHPKLTEQEDDVEKMKYPLTY